MPTSINPPVRLEFPTFTNASIDNPDKELLASLAVVAVVGTAKD